MLGRILPRLYLSHQGDEKRPSPHFGGRIGSDISPPASLFQSKPCRPGRTTPSLSPPGQQFPIAVGRHAPAEISARDQHAERRVRRPSICQPCRPAVPSSRQLNPHTPHASHTTTHFVRRPLVRPQTSHLLTSDLACPHTLTPHIHISYHHPLTPQSHRTHSSALRFYQEGTLSHPSPYSTLASSSSPSHIRFSAPKRAEVLCGHLPRVGGNTVTSRGPVW